MNEQHFGYKVRQHLNRGVHDLPQTTLDRLHAARAAALAHQKQPTAIPVLAFAGRWLSFGDGSWRFHQFMAALALLLCSIFSAFYVADRRAEELGDIDSAILADELPIGVFTDKGFAAWLNSNSPQ